MGRITKAIAVRMIYTAGVTKVRKLIKEEKITEVINIDDAKIRLLNIVATGTIGAMLAELDNMVNDTTLYKETTIEILKSLQAKFYTM